MRRYSEEETTNGSLARRFPNDLRLSDSTDIVITPMVASDWPYFKEFESAIPSVEKILFEDTLFANRQLLYSCTRLNYVRLLPLVAWQQATITAIAVLLTQHESECGQFCLVVHPGYRRVGLGTRMVEEVVEVARTMGLTELVADCPTQPMDAISLLMNFGFLPIASRNSVRETNRRTNSLIRFSRSLGWADRSNPHG